MAWLGSGLIRNLAFLTLGLAMAEKSGIPQFAWAGHGGRGEFAAQDGDEPVNLLVCAVSDLLACTRSLVRGVWGRR